jgi:hypothetical protein
MKFEYYGWDDGTSLYHFGILGQKWGVRRFQNPDGTLTEEGKRRYATLSADKSYKELKKAIRNKRAMQSGRSPAIGKYSKAVIDDADAKRKAYANSKEFKSWESNYDRQMKKAFNDVENGKMTIEQYNKLDKSLWSQRPKKNFDDYAEWVYIAGKGYVNDYIKKGGKTLTVAKLRDLGFDEKTANSITEKLIKSNKTLATI